MPTVVIPFAGVEGKTRLHASRRARRALSLAMLGVLVGLVPLWWAVRWLVALFHG